MRSSGWILALLLGVLVCMGVAHAAEERYDYDALGRLIRVVDEQGRVTEYVYDPVGNILQVINGGAAVQAPVITSISPSIVRQGRPSVVQVTGSGLQGVRVSAADPSIDISSLVVTATTVTFTLTTATTTALGNYVVTFSNAGGSAQATVSVALPIAYTISPNFLPVPPDNVARAFTITASEADSVPVTLTAVTGNQAIARTGAAPMILAAGQTEVTGTITGVAAGTTVLTLMFTSSINAAPLSVATVYVGTDYAGTSGVLSKALGVVKGDPNSPAPGTVLGPVLTAPLGVVKGDPNSPAPGTVLGPVLAAPLGMVKGDPNSPAPGTVWGPVMAPILGVDKN